MTKETILENCQRVLFFLKNKPDEMEEVKNDDLNPLGLLKHYGLILDINGCFRNGASILYLPNKEEFEEFRNYAALNFKDSFKERNNQEEYNKLLEHIPNGDFGVISPSKFMFEYDGYYWEVENK